jgi:hypothetical protein
LASEKALRCQTIYYWGTEPQSRFLLQEVAELFGRWKLKSADSRYTFLRFNARGPHLLFIIRDSSAEVVLAHCEDLVRAVGRVPSTEELGGPALEEMHLSCRGTCLTDLDRLAGCGHNNSSVTSGAQDLCYSFFSDRVGSDNFWEGITPLCDWALRRLQQGSASEGLFALTSALSALFTEQGEDPRNLWFAYARSLRPSADPELLAAALRERLDANPELDSLLSRSKATAEISSLKAQSKMVLLESAASGSLLWSARELVHIAGSQMGLPVRVELTIILATIIQLYRRDISASGFCASD